MQNIACTTLLVSAMIILHQQPIDYRRRNWAVLTQAPWFRPSLHAFDPPSQVITNQPCIECTLQRQGFKYYCYFLVNIKSIFWNLEVSLENRTVMEKISQYYDHLELSTTNLITEISNDYYSQVDPPDFLSSCKYIFIFANILTY